MLIFYDIQSFYLDIFSQNTALQGPYSKISSLWVPEQLAFHQLVAYLGCSATANRPTISETKYQLTEIYYIYYVF